LLHFTVPEQFAAVRVAVSTPHTCVLLAEMLGAAGNAPVVIVTGFEATLVPQVEVQVAVYVPAPTWVVVPVALLLQVTVPVQPVAVRVAVSAPHICVLFAEMVGGTDVPPVVMVTELDATLVPQVEEQVAVYVPAPTWMLVPVALLLQLTVPVQPVAVSVAFSSPQTCVLLAEILGAAGNAPVVIVTELEATLVPQVLVQVAVYVPAPTWVVVPVALLLQVTVPVQFEAVKVACSIPQI